MFFFCDIITYVFIYACVTSVIVTRTCYNVCATLCLYIVIAVVFVARNTFDTISYSKTCCSTQVSC